ncbi:STAS domain-containing protein, partial [Consotaella aegiceratis]|uniref:STAS domain-containing protein n=1 Tax=Consotaella aegiceratis TaxID=3097961 RepID=UPI002F3EF080
GRVLMARKKQASAETVELPSQLGLNAAGPLSEQLMGLRGKPVVLDASKVEAVGGQGLQVLLAAAIAWAGDGVELTFGEPSPAFEDDLGHLGMSVETLLNKGQLQ